jgi:outer membrane protein assembly factor BamB
LKFMRNKKTLIRVSVLFIVLLTCAVLLSGCVRGMSPIGWSGVLISGNTVYTGTKEGRLVSLDLSANNAKKFAEPLKAASTGGSACGSSSGGGACGGAPAAVAIYGTPATTNVAVFGDLVYIAGYNGKVFAYDAASLQQRWVYPVEGNISPIISAVVVSGNTLYFGGTDGIVYALDTQTGAEKWKYQTGGEIWSTPAIDNNLLFISSFDNKIYALDINNNGAKKWEYPTNSTNVAPPVTANGVVYAGSLDRNMYAINEADGSLKWKYEAGNWFWAKPIIAGNVIFAPCLDNKIYGLDLNNGKNVVTYDTQNQVSSWPVLVDNQVIAITQSGKVWSLDTNPANFNKNDSQKMVTNLPAGVDPTAPLGASGTNVYVNGSDNFLYIVDIAKGTVSSGISLKSQ